MSNYSSLKSAIDANIKANGRREITGPVLNAILNAVVNSLGDGYLFRGVAIPSTNPGTPDQNVAYLAITEGTYTHMGGLSVTDGELSVFSYNGAWSKIPLALVPTKTSQLDNDLRFVTSEEMGESLSSKQDTIQDLSEIRSGAALANNSDHRPYNSSNPDGMGYLVLKKNKTFAEQVTEEDTIYEIRYDFDLGGGSVTIPEGCVLSFNGGSLSNGTLSGDDFRVEADLVKVFDGITFTGNCIKNIYELDWFVGNKNSFCDLTSAKKDSTAEVQAAFDSGVMNLHISNQFCYYISSTLVVKSWVSLVGNEISVTHFRGNAQGEPSFYTDQTITILKVLGDSDSNNKIQKEILLDNVHFRHYGTIGENDYHMDVPVLFITNGTGVNSQVWGVNLNVNIYVADMNIPSLGRFMFGYTGIEIYADHGFYFTYINIDGRIYGCRRGVYIHKLTGGASWITDVRLGFDSTCVWGGQIDASPVRITGSHQPSVQLTKEEVDANPAYFDVPSCVSTGMVWDIGTTQVTNGVTYYNIICAFKSSTADVFDFVTDSIPLIPDNSVIPYGNRLKKWRSNLWKLIPFTSNYLEKAFNGIVGWQLSDNIASGMTYAPDSPERGYMESLRGYNSQGEYIDLTEDDITNYSKLFNLGGSDAMNGNIRYIESDTCALKSSVISSGYTKIEASFLFKRQFVYNFINSNSFFVAVINYDGGANLGKCYLVVEFLDDSDVVLDTKTITFNPTDAIFYSRFYLREFGVLNTESNFTKVRMKFRDDRTKTDTTALAKYGIITRYALDNSISTSGGEVTGPLVMRNVKFDLRNVNNGCRYEHNIYINRSIGISTNAYTKILNIQPLYQRPVFVLLMRQNGGIAVITLEKDKLTCSDPSINCKLEIHTNSYMGRYLLSVKGVVNETIVIYSVYSVSAMKFIDVNETHESGYFDTTLTQDAVKTSGATSARPASPATGQTFFDTTLGKMIVYNGTAWVNMDGTALS